ncbi:MAG: flocculation-associated PEP-CTERM protein PepA [Alphaproteobacteria bacterium]|nr:MAG: flocculation-associated PEP-CTERM protein PepA [Alphaproteobacteria bacterium]
MKTLLKTLAIGAVGGMLSVAAQAGPVTYTANPANGGAAGAAFQADKITGPYSAEIDQDNAGNFTESGLIQFGNFSLGGTNLGGGTSGLGTSYNLYGLFTAAGTATATPLGGGLATVVVKFTSFLAEIWTDPNRDSTFSFNAANANDQDGFTGQNAGSQFADAGGSAAHSLTNTAEDQLVLQITGGLSFPRVATLLVNTSNGGVLSGGFNVKSKFNTDFGAPGEADDFFQFFPFNFLNLNLLASGQTGQTTGNFFNPGGFTDNTFQNASVDVTFIPEPTTVGLFGLGLLGLGAMARRRRRKV